MTSPLSSAEVVRFLSYVLTDIYITLPLGESSVSEERVRNRPSPAATASDPPASGRVKCLY